MAKRQDYTHLLGVHSFALCVEGIERRTSKRGWSQVSLLVVCDCGNHFSIPTDRLGKTKSCGCQTSNIITESKIRHGASRRRQWTPEYKTWAGMIQRCTNQNVRAYDRYGGRGIRVCDRWRQSFESFLDDMGPKPPDTDSIDRIDNDGHYEPGNCRWTTNDVQARSKRRYIEAFGENLPVQEWAARLNTSTNTILARLGLGWTPEEAVSRPPTGERR